MGDVAHIHPPHPGLFKADAEILRSIRYFVGHVPAGFPSSAQDYVEEDLNVNRLIGVDRPSVFCTRVRGDSMTGAGIYDGDLLFVDFAVKPRCGSIVVAILNGELTVKRLRINRDEYLLVPENAAYKAMRFDKSEELAVWGVVTFNLHDHTR